MGRRVEELAHMAAGLPATTARAHGYQALIGPEQARALGADADWRPAAASFRRMGDQHMVAYTLLRRAEASPASDREAATAAARESLGRSLARSARDRCATLCSRRVAERGWPSRKYLWRRRTTFRSPRTD